MYRLPPQLVFTDYIYGHRPILNHLHQQSLIGNKVNGSAWIGSLGSSRSSHCNLTLFVDTPHKKSKHIGTVSSSYLLKHCPRSQDEYSRCRCVFATAFCQCEQILVNLICGLYYKSCTIVTTIRSWDLYCKTTIQAEASLGQPQLES